ncbi:MAG: hypothetical protein NT139_00340 [Candidatus Woesearchaeota archaeon]|nr:hypothetical protein [Candidatus Woesearchaeota archaeon]
MKIKIDNRKILLLVILVLGLVFIFNNSTTNITGKIVWPWITGNALNEKCTDTDNGLNYNIFGIVSKNDKYYQDECYMNTSFLKERYCENNEPKMKWYECPNRCSNGKCI